MIPAIGITVFFIGLLMFVLGMFFNNNILVDVGAFTMLFIFALAVVGGVVDMWLEVLK